MAQNSNPDPHRRSDAALSSVKVFHELMAKKVREVLLVSSPYDAFIMEEDGRLAGRIIGEYHGLNLSRPPRLTWVSTGQKALALLEEAWFDIVIIMPRLNDMDCAQLGEIIKNQFPKLPVLLLTHTTSPALVRRDREKTTPFDRMYVWQGNTDLLLALIKNVEDRMNVAQDTRLGRVPVMILVEDDPLFISVILPLLYREIVLQTQRVIDESTNEEQRLLRMRARPKLLTAETYEEAWRLFREYGPHVLCVISDVRFQKDGGIDDTAGLSLLGSIRREHPELALLNLSENENNRRAVASIPAVFIHKHDSDILGKIRAFFTEHLGFGDFVFRSPQGEEIGRAHNLRSMEKILPQIPEAVLVHHAVKNHFSTWFRARAEIELADRIRPLNVSDAPSGNAIRERMIRFLSENRRGQQRGVVIDFSAEDFDPESDFVKIGDGSLGGKARGLAFMSSLLRATPDLFQEFPQIDIRIPKALVITTDGFDLFMEAPGLQRTVATATDDDVIKEAFRAASFPQLLRQHLEVYLSKVHCPLAVRSSSLLEDSHSQPFAGIYHTAMIPNTDMELSVRLEGLIEAVKAVYASTFLNSARTFSENTLHRSDPDKMAVIIQQVVGSRHGDVFYPALSGVASSYNYYPTDRMVREDGVACIALGLGKTVVDGSGGLRFSPKTPDYLPGFSTVDEILKNAQHRFYALKLTSPDTGGARAPDTDALVQLTVEDARDHFPVSYLSSRYLPEDHRIRQTGGGEGHLVLTFDNILKQKKYPLGQLLFRLLALGQNGMGGAVEMEFALDFSGAGEDRPPVFAVLQLRPAADVNGRSDVAISEVEREKAVCFSSKSLGNGTIEDIEDILYVDPEAFDPSKTVEIARQIGKIGRSLVDAGRKYILIGPGRWGSADPWLGIPVKWEDISGAGVIIETVSDKIKALPSQGSHFFHNITALGIGYLTIAPGIDGTIDWGWLGARPEVSRTVFVRHIRATPAPTIKIDGKTSRAIIYEP